ncbi:MAG: methyltransferase domain-containing protein [Candidatus Aenigmarchaeota archaeon]|nr:methyltransferase domain-containing protein [Candidatus Aenigmarchaeota archaeon]
MVFLRSLFGKKKNKPQCNYPLCTEEHINYVKEQLFYLTDTIHKELYPANGLFSAPSFDISIQCQRGDEIRYTDVKDMDISLGNLRIDCSHGKINIPLACIEDIDYIIPSYGCKHIKDGSKVLNIGCSKTPIASCDFETICADLIENVLKHNDQEGIACVAKKLPFKDNSFDYVVSKDAYIKGKDASEMLRICKKGGEIILINDTDTIKDIETYIASLGFKRKLFFNKKKKYIKGKEYITIYT